MKRLIRNSLICIAVLAVLVACVSSAVIYHGGRWRPYAPPYVPPSLMAGFGGAEEDQPVQLAFLPKADDPFASFASFDTFQRPPLASRGLVSLQGYDPRLFCDQIATHAIELKSAPDELANIELAAASIDGRIIAPGATFSFNDAVGERSEDRGFRPGLMFCKGAVVMGVGGGVCIVSTALYDDAVRSGFQILERSPHSGTVRYAEPGMDAAVVFGCMDMRFINNTPYPVLIRTSIEDRVLTVSLYSRKQQGMSVELAREDFKEIPYKIIEKEDSTVPEGTVTVKTTARTGFEATMIRTIKLNGTVIKHEVLSRDRVPARDKVVLIPPAKPAVPTETKTQPTPEPMSEPANESSPPTWTLPTHETMPQLDIRLGMNKHGD